jgi:hypothetical protein
VVVVGVVVVVVVVIVVDMALAARPVGVITPLFVFFV